MRHSLFALEVCARIDLAPELLPRLRQRIAGAPAAVGLQEKWQLYRGCADDLLANFGAIERGCWDFFDDNDKAKKGYDDYANAMTTYEAARAGPMNAVDPYRGQEPDRYLTFTMAFLIARDTETERQLSTLCNVPEPSLWRRDTFDLFLKNFSVLSFASVRSDVVYLIPRDEGWGLTREDLQDEKFAYLRALED